MPAMRRQTAEDVPAAAVIVRVFAFHDAVWQTARLASIGLGGSLGDAYGITVVYVTGAALLLTVGALGVSLRSEDTHHEPEPRSAPGSGFRRRRISLTTGCPGL